MQQENKGESKNPNRR